MSEENKAEKSKGIRHRWTAFKGKLSSENKQKKSWLKIAVLICVVIAALVVLFSLFVTFHHYQSVYSIEKSDGDTTNYASFGNLIIRYGNDGASCIASDNTIVWDEAYEMDNPIISVRHNYLAIGDRRGKTVIIFNKEGFCQKITAELPIQKIDVSDTGSVAVLMQDEGSISYLGLYSLSGKKTAEGTLHFGSSGYPLAIALSEDGENLALSVLDIKDGQSKSTINFYNFGQTPAEGKDNQVASFSYDNTVIPEICYGSGSQLVAFGDDKLISFEGGKTPEEKNVLALEGTVRSIVHDSERIGILYDQGEEGSGNTLVLYDYDGDEKRHYSAKYQYESIGFLGNGGVYLIQDKNLAVYRRFGRAIFIGKGDTPFYGVMSEGYGMRYIFIREGKTEQVRLSLF